MHPPEIHLAGRERELELVLEPVKRTPATGLALVLVAGEAGIGKSRLLAEATARLAGGGSQVLALAADELQRRIPYSALTAAVRSLPAGEGTPRGEARNETLAALDLMAADPATPPGAWFGRACEATARMLSALSGTKPVVLAIDDLDQLDDDSLALLTLVLRRLSDAPLALVGTLRSPQAEHNPAAVQLLERLADHADVVRVELDALSGDDVGAIASEVIGMPVDAGLAREVHRRSDGNPFFATEIARSLQDLELVTVEENRARLSVASEAIRLTRRDAVLRRVAPLVDEIRAVARAVSVLRRVRLDQLGLIARVAGLPDDVVTPAFDELLRAGILTRDEAGVYRFFHALVAEALYDDIGPARRRHLHALVADRLLDDRAHRLAVDVLELAWHVSESAQPGDDVAVTVLAEAADLARPSAPERAATLCGRALELLPAKSAERADLLSLQCRSLYRASRPADAIEPGRIALDLLPPGTERSRAATAVVGSLFSLGRLDEALAVVEGEIARERCSAPLHAQRAMLLAFTGRYGEAIAASDAAEALPMISPAEEVIVFNQLAMLASMLYRHEKTFEHANRALRAGGEQPALQLQALALGATTVSLVGLVHDAAWRLRRAEELLGAAGGHAFRAEILLSRIALDWLGGRWDAALEGLGTATAEIEAGQSVILIDALQAIELDIRAWRGEFEIAERLAARPAPTTPNMFGLHLLALVDYHIARGDVDAARSTIEETVADPEAVAYGCVQLSRLIDVEVDEGRTESAARLLQVLVDIASRRFSPLSRTALRRATGLVHRDPDELRRAVEEAHTGGLEFEKARAQLALGELDPGETATLEEAYLTFQRLGAHGLRRRAGRRMRELGAKVPRMRSRRAGLLTDAEERIARLVQQGMRNRDIATALHYSPRTIEVYLSRIYAKLHVSSRLELARTLDTIDRR